MSDQEQDSLALLEQRRLQLEEQISGLDKLLSHWRSWETDYELFKEEVLSVPENESEKTLHATILANFEGDVLKGEEVKKLMLDDRRQKRSRSQLLDVLRHRLDYVRGNVDSITKRRDAADNKLLGIDVVLKPDMVDEDGLPLTEIMEELDEDGNVISSSTRNTAKDAPALMEKLESQGLTDESLQSRAANAQMKAMDEKIEAAEAARAAALGTNSTEKADTAQAAANAKAEQLLKSLAEDEREAKGEDEDDDDEESAQLSVARLLSSISDLDPTKMTTLGPGLKMKESDNFKTVPKNSLKQQDGEEPIIPTDESEEDAALRREMLQYSLNEVGAVVAEMDFEQDDDDDDDGDEDDYDDDEDYDYDDEDDFGRSTKPVISEEYRQQMLELEKQLDARALRNLGPVPGRISPPSSEEDVQPNITPKALQKAAVVSTPPESSLKKEKKAGKTKGVRFAENLDVAQDKPNSQPRSVEAVKDAPLSARSSEISPLADQVQERQPRVRLSVPSHSDARKVSRFKATRASDESASTSNAKAPKAAPRGPLSDNVIGTLKPMSDGRADRFASTLLSMTTEKPRFTPEGPEGKTLDDVIERAPSDISATDPGEDAGLARQALATEHYRQRNNKIYQQGGFQAEDPAIIPLDVNGEEIRPKVSRFKAARMGKGNN